MTPSSILKLSLLCALLPASSLGCAQNSIFELTLEVPPAPAGRENMVVEGQTGNADWEADWQQTQISGIQLDPVINNTVLVSFETSGDKLVEELRVKVRFCQDEQCREVADGNAPEVRYRFERVFYQGRFTTNDQTIDMYPDPTDPLGPPEFEVDKCVIVGDGCRDGGSENNCLSDGRHFCEDT